MEQQQFGQFYTAQDSTVDQQMNAKYMFIDMSGYHLHVLIWWMNNDACSIMCNDF